MRTGRFNNYYFIIKLILLIILTRHTIATLDFNETVLQNKYKNSTFFYENYKKCADGLILPSWKPTTNLSFIERCLRGLCYLFIMAYLFIGIAIGSERFLVAIEVIISKEKRSVRTRADGTKSVYVERLWNETIANLTISCFGYNCPEVILIVVELIGKDFKAGNLGPSVAIGCAIFNLTIILGICIMVIPKGETRQIKDYLVFYVLFFWSFVGMVWMYIIISIWTPEHLPVWQCLILLAIYPISVVNAYLASKRMCIYKLFYKESNNADARLSVAKSYNYQFTEDDDDVDFEQARRQYISVLKNLRKKYPQFDLDKLELMAHEQILREGKKSRGFYRIIATHRMIGTGALILKVRERAELDMKETKAQLQRVQIRVKDEDAVLRVFFDPGHYNVMDNVGEVELRVVRQGNLSHFTTVEYSTGDGTAIADRDYIAKTGILHFPAEVAEQRFKIEIIDDGSFNEDLQFFVKLRNPERPAILSTPNMASIMILDTDHAGIFELTESEYEVEETINEFNIKVIRTCGARGQVKIPYKTLPDTALPGKDYISNEGILIFENEETEQYITIKIINGHSYEKIALFILVLEHPIMISNLITQIEQKAPEDRTVREELILMGRPKLGKNAYATISITENLMFRNKVDLLVEKANSALLVGSKNWNENYNVNRRKATSKSSLDKQDDYNNWPNCADYFMHLITIFWKTVFLVVPPANIAGGYFCFFMSIVIIGIICAVLIDVAIHFGCTLGINDIVTAVTLVVIGGNIADVFACQLSALHDKQADEVIGNIFCSNTIILFGVGLAWTVGAIHHSCNNRIFELPEGGLDYMIIVYIPAQIIIIIIIIVRGRPPINAVLGGPVRIKYISSIILFSIWIIFILLCIIKTYVFV